MEESRVGCKSMTLEMWSTLLNQQGGDIVWSA